MAMHLEPDFIRFRLELPVLDLSGGLGGLTLPRDIADSPSEDLKTVEGSHVNPLRTAVSRHGF